MDESTLSAVEDWKRNNETIECPMGAKITHASCRLRQDKLPHFFRQFIGDGWITHIASEFVVCASCEHYRRNIHDAHENKRMRGNRK